MEDIRLIRTSERVSYKSCRQRWYWAYVDGLTVKKPSNPLRFGSLVHEALALWYKPGKKRGVHPARTFKKMALKEMEELGPLFAWDADEEKSVDGLAMGIDLLEHYVEHYGKDENIEVIAPEQPFQVDIYDPETDEYVCTYVGTIDAVIRNLSNGKLGLFEHKTGRSAAKAGAPLALDEQAGSYFAYGPAYLSQELGIDEDIDFMMYNYLRKAFRDDRPQNTEGQYLNKDGTVSKRQPPEFFKREFTFRSPTDRANLMYRVIEEAREMEMVRNGELAVLKNPGDHCNWCEFRDMCEIHETGSDWEAIRDEMFTTWNPYEVHDESFT